MKLYCYSFCLLISGSSLAQSTLDSFQLMKDIRILSADKFEGRKTGTRGSRLAQFYIIDRFKQIGLAAYHGTYEYPFYFKEKNKQVMGTNLYGYIPGKINEVIVISAHYDHLGTTPAGAFPDTVYNGADDNASGVGGLLAIAQYFKKYPPRYTLIFAALDGEEEGLQGAKAFLKQPPVSVTHIRQNINMDMISHNDRNELYVCGTYQYPFLKKYIAGVASASGILLKTGHDTPETHNEDWTNQSDQYEFYKQKIPFLYFGVEDHPDYHQLTDEYIRINHSFYYRAVQTILSVLLYLDNSLPER